LSHLILLYHQDTISTCIQRSKDIYTLHYTLCLTIVHDPPTLSPFNQQRILGQRTNFILSFISFTDPQITHKQAKIYLYFGLQTQVHTFIHVTQYNTVSSSHSHKFPALESLSLCGRRRWPLVKQNKVAVNMFGLGWCTFVKRCKLETLGFVHLVRWVWGRGRGWVWVNLRVKCVLFFLRNLEVIVSEFRSKVYESLWVIWLLWYIKNVLIYFKEILPFCPLCKK